MAYDHYDRLSAVDAVFLEIEDANIHMHVGAVALFERQPLETPDGRLDIERLRTFLERSLPQSPRLRQRIVEVPVVGHPVWVDDPRFNLHYHFRHAALPPPGDARQLKRLAGRIVSQKLDRGKPLWELWIVEGLEDGRIALVLKAHHCMVDGIAGVDLLAALLRLSPEAEMPEPHAWVPRPEPDGARLLADEVGRRAALPLEMLRAAPRRLSEPGQLVDDVRESLSALGETIGAGLAPTTPTPLNPDIGPYRRFDWTLTELAEVAEVRKHLGGTLNDVVLATVSGAVGRFLAQRGERPDRDTVFRVMVPVSIRKRDEHGVPGNRVVNFLARLPVDERNPRKRLERTIEVTSKLKRSRLVHGAEILEELSDRTFTSLVVEFVRLAANQRAYNMVVTNVPGPPRPVYLLGARMTEIYPVVPLFSNQGLGIALFSYDGRLCWGLDADWDALPDLHDFTLAIDEEFAALREAAEPAAAERAASRRRAKSI
ncbi:MAG: wax ester/triacylglycerol synthase family O-acyltransferase [Myxococcota bacterium]|nr:wax ester/triacylglycerol synthase family O-acyltransferase [Myxococcota bacterium]